MICRLGWNFFGRPSYQRDPSGPADGGVGFWRKIERFISETELPDSAHAASINQRSADNLQTGSVRPGSPVISAAWQRQPPKSISCRGQFRHNSGIHSVPRNLLKLSESVQIQSN